MASSNTENRDAAMQRLVDEMRIPAENRPAATYGLVIALLAASPIRIKNFAELEVGKTFKEINGRWWICIPASKTKSHRIDERRVPKYLNKIIEFYLIKTRPRLIGSKSSTNWLWISSRTGGRFTTKNLGTLISKTTLQTIGVDVSPHLFR